MIHLFNCHGEWFVILSVLANLPVAGIWILTIMERNREDPPEE